VAHTTGDGTTTKGVQTNVGYQDMRDGNNLRGVIRYTDADRAVRATAATTVVASAVASDDARTTVLQHDDSEMTRHALPLPYTIHHSEEQPWVSELESF